MATPTFEQFVKDYLGIDLANIEPNHIAVLAQPCVQYAKRSTVLSITDRLLRLRAHQHDPERAHALDAIINETLEVQYDKK